MTPLDPLRRTLTDRAMDALGALIAVVAIVLAVWVALDLGLRLLIAAGLGDPWALLLTAVAAAASLGWVAGKVGE